MDKEDETPEIYIYIYIIYVFQPKKKKKNEIKPSLLAISSQSSNMDATIDFHSK